MTQQRLSKLEARIADYECDTVGVRGDHLLNPEFVDPRPVRDAAVLILLINRNDKLSVMFTQRTDHLSNHPGQISLPGGRVDDGDASPIETAIRETEEELGIDRNFIKIFGRIDTYKTGTGFSVSPIVGVINEPFDMTPDPDEVASVFEVPLDFFLTRENHKQEVRQFEDDLIWYTYSIPYEEYHIWGITAGVMRNFYEVASGSPIPIDYNRPAQNEKKA